MSATHAAAATPLLRDWPAPVRPADARVIVAVVAGGAGLDLVARAGIATVSAAAVVAVGATLFVWAGRVRNPQAVALAGASLLFAGFVAVRTTPWVVVPNILAAVALIVAAAAFARGGSVTDVSAARLAVRVVEVAVNTVLGPAYVAGVGRSERRSGAFAVVRGVALAAPIAVVLGVLLASADAVFAAVFRFDAEALVFHAMVFAAGAGAAAALLRTAATPAVAFARARTPQLGAIEWTIILLTIDALFAGLASARIVAMSEGGRRVLHTAGLTYAEYARSGFFQLLAVAAITAAVLAALRATAERDHPRHLRRFRVLALVTLALTGAVLASAVHRLVLYDRAFGLTALRLYALAACAWVAAVLVMSAAWLWSARGGRNWFPFASGAAGLVVLLALSVIGPAGHIARHNVARAHEAGRIDAVYLASLGADAVPALAEALPRLDGNAAIMVRAAICSHRPSPDGWWSYNLARAEARRAADRVCRVEEEGTP